MRLSWFGFAFAAALAAVAPSPGIAPAVHAQASMCNLSGYKAAPGLSAAVAGDAGSDVGRRRNRSTAAVDDQQRRRRSRISPSATKVERGRRDTISPEYRVVSGWRRMDREAYPGWWRVREGRPGVARQSKWMRSGTRRCVPGGEGRAWRRRPTLGGIRTNQPGLPRKPEEVKRATATFKAQGCDVKTDGGRIEVSFSGVDMGIFSGRLQYTVYKGTNLIRQEVIAKTDQESVAYKYDAGVKGLTIQPDSRVVWRDR
jgi:hypothetical protein